MSITHPVNYVNKTDITLTTDTDQSIPTFMFKKYKAAILNKAVQANHSQFA